MDQIHFLFFASAISYWQLKLPPNISGTKIQNFEVLLRFFSFIQPKSTSEQLWPKIINFQSFAFNGLTAAKVKENQTIALVRIHLQRAIQRVKKFKVIRNQTLHVSANHLQTVGCTLCNFLLPLIQTQLWFGNKFLDD